MCYNIHSYIKLSIRDKHSYFKLSIQDIHSYFKLLIRDMHIYFKLSIWDIHSYFKLLIQDMHSYFKLSIWDIHGNFKLLIWVTFNVTKVWKLSCTHKASESCRMLNKTLHYVQFFFTMDVQMLSFPFCSRNTDHISTCITSA